MYHILVVDDEDGERDGIAYLIQECKLPLTVAEAGNGRQALEYMNNHPVDILLTDIKMPFIGGLELARRAEELYKNIKVIFFSAYGEFDYAREAVKLDAFYYLLKPIVVDEFVEVMNNAIHLCEEEEDRKKREKNQQEQFLKMKAYSQKKLLFDMLNGNYSDLDDQVKLIDMELDLRNIYMIGVSFKQRFFDVHNDSLEKELETLIGRRYACLNLDEYQSVIFVERALNELEESRIIKLGQRLMNVISGKYKMTVCVVISRAVSNPEDIYGEYQRMEQKMEYRFFLNDSMILFSWNEETKMGDGEDVVQKISENICLSLEKQDYYSAEQGIGLLFGAFKNRYNSTILCKYTCAEIVKKMLRLMGSAEEGDFDGFLGKLFGSDSLNILQEEVLYLLEKLKISGLSNETKSANKSIYVIMNYIQNNYGRDISLESIGKAVYFSPGYLSAFFKKETGQSLTKYITSYRLEKAKELLERTNKKVVDISREVGFSDNSYFCMVFRNYTGESPARFRERNFSR